jgi:hypothetical protein
MEVRTGTERFAKLKHLLRQRHAQGRLAPLCDRIDLRFADQVVCTKRTTP